MIGPLVSSLFFPFICWDRSIEEKNRRVCSRYRKAIIHNLPGSLWNIACSKKVSIIVRNERKQKATLDTRNVVVSLNQSHNARLNSWQITIQKLSRTAWMKLEELVVKENMAEGNMLGKWSTDAPWLMKFPVIQFTKRKQKKKKLK